MKQLLCVLLTLATFNLYALDMEAANKVCQEIGERMNMGDASPLTNRMNAALFAERVNPGYLPEAIAADVQQAAGAVGMLANQFAQQAQQGALIKFLGIAPFNGVEHAAKFRIVIPQSNGYIYLFAMLAEDNGNIVIGDLYTHSLSMWMSAYMLQTMVLGNAKGMELEQYSAFWGQDVTAEEKDAISKFYINVLTNPAQAANDYETMPNYVKEREGIMATLITMTNRAAPDNMPQVLQLAKKYTHKSPLLNMHLVAEKSHAGDIPAAREALEKVYTVVGKDAYYHYQVANLALFHEHWDQALKAFEASREAEPDFYLSTIEESYIYVRKENFDKAVELLQLAETNAGIDFPRESFTNDPDYAGMVASEAFKAWKPEQTEAAPVE